MVQHKTISIPADMFNMKKKIINLQTYLYIFHTTKTFKYKNY